MLFSDAAAESFQGSDSGHNDVKVSQRRGGSDVNTNNAVQ